MAGRGPRQDSGLGRLEAHIHEARLEDINKVFADLEAGTVDGRMVVDLG